MTMRWLRLLSGLAGAVLPAGLALAATSTAVEYYHAGYGHYFATASPQEIAGLDAGIADGG